MLMRSGNEDAEKELISSGAIRRVLDLFFEYAIAVMFVSATIGLTFWSRLSSILEI